MMIKQLIPDLIEQLEVRFSSNMGFNILLVHFSILKANY